MIIDKEYVIDSEVMVKISEIASIYKNHMVTRIDNSWGARKELDGYDAVICVLKSGKEIPIPETNLCFESNYKLLQFRLLYGEEKYKEEYEKWKEREIKHYSDHSPFKHLYSENAEEKYAS